MSESYKEQRPLLCDISDEEFHIVSPVHHRRVKYSVLSGRSAARVKGAALIIKHWPDHIASLLTYCWIAFSMIAVIVFIIYNSFTFIGAIPPPYLPVTDNEIVHADNASKTNDNTTILDIYMHVVVKEYNEINIDKYLQYIKTLAKKFPQYRYHFIVVINDVNKSRENMISDKKNNEKAFNSILNEKSTYKNENWNSISVKYILINDIFDNSPVKENWQQLSLEIREFLIRCLSIWNNGGIAFDPNIITPQTPNPLYMRNLMKILKKYNKSKSNIMEHNAFFKLKPKLKVNNIRDIINMLERDNNNDDNLSEYTLSVADNKEKLYSINATDKSYVNKSKRSIENLALNKENVMNELTKENISKKSETSNKFNILLKNNKNSDEPSEYSKHVSIEQSIIKDKNWTKIYENVNHINIDNENIAKYVKSNKNNLISTSNSTLNIGPVTLFNLSEITNRNQPIPEFTVDLSGRFLATKTPCHAFIGTIFSNIKHYTLSNATIKDVISAELSLFCKGKQNSCNFIDVIFL